MGNANTIGKKNERPIHKDSNGSTPCTYPFRPQRSAVAARMWVKYLERNEKRQGINN
jgi:hypothetical protein